MFESETLARVGSVSLASECPVHSEVWVTGGRLGGGASGDPRSLQRELDSCGLRLKKVQDTVRVQRNVFHRGDLRQASSCSMTSALSASVPSTTPIDREPSFASCARSTHNIASAVQTMAAPRVITNAGT